MEIALDPHGREKGMTAPIPFIRVADLEAAVAEVEKVGATIAPRDVGGGTRIATLTGPDGNTLGLIHRT